MRGGVVCKKKWKVWVFLLKKWTFPQRSLHYVQHQYFFCFTFYLLRGAYAPNTPPACGPEHTDGHRERFRVVPLSCQHDQACVVCCSVCKIK